MMIAPSRWIHLAAAGGHVRVGIYLGRFPGYDAAWGDRRFTPFSWSGRLRRRGLANLGCESRRASFIMNLPGGRPVMTDQNSSPVHLSVIVPAFNEEKRIGPSLVEIAKYLNGKAFTSEVIVVDDGSTDQTADVARKTLQGRLPFRVLRRERNMGKGYSIREGVRTSRPTSRNSKSFCPGSSGGRTS
jgi:hypothetical protein